MATDKDFNQFISASIDLENLELSNYDPSSVRAFNKKRTILTNKEIDELKSIKSYDLLFDFFKVHKIDNAEERIKNLKKQSNSFYSFLKKYPEFKTLPLKEKRSLLSTRLESSDELQINLRLNKIQANSKLMVIDPSEELLYDFNVAIYGCQASYRTAWLTIWATCDIALLGAAFDPSYVSTVVIFASALTANYIAEAAMYDCYDTAADVFFSKLSRL